MVLNPCSGTMPNQAAPQVSNMIDAVGLVSLFLPPSAWIIGLFSFGTRTSTMPIPAGEQWTMRCDGQLGADRDCSTSIQSDHPGLTAGMIDTKATQPLVSQSKPSILSGLASFGLIPSCLVWFSSMSA
ncbi:uncharacterized protein LDX57_012000 [Aspergillus melleus]|uniref:uncharacterized protein n=1 Tax=Aspergillus melleus TaxID=138277 RepID=UPI001E8DB854|nr:uncharacterized protein LDX57_012000 [Aspergillus melleus]KAH8434352.1 hypothetical protein LDX57_012000 [Aspergillus melleus]